MTRQSKGRTFVRTERCFDTKYRWALPMRLQSLPGGALPPVTKTRAAAMLKIRPERWIEIPSWRITQCQQITITFALDCNLLISCAAEKPGYRADTLRQQARRTLDGRSLAGRPFTPCREVVRESKGTPHFQTGHVGLDAGGALRRDARKWPKIMAGDHEACRNLGTAQEVRRQGITRC